MSTVIGWVTFVAGIAAICVGCALDPANWWWIVPGIVAVIVGLVCAAYKSDFAGDLIESIVDAFVWVVTFEWLESLFD